MSRGIRASDLSPLPSASSNTAARNALKRLKAAKYHSTGDTDFALKTLRPALGETSLDTPVEGDELQHAPP